MSEDKQSDKGPKDADALAIEANQKLADAKRELQELQDKNEQLATEMQVECEEAVTPVSDSKFVHGLGKYMVPVDNSLDSHHSLIFDRSNELDFWPEQSPAFDSLVSQTFLDPAFSCSNHPNYFDYEPLRDNVATLRNYVLATVLDGVDVSDPKQMENATRTLEQMGREVGVALQRDSLFRRPGSAHVSVHQASDPGEGAAKLYELLVKKQEKNKFLHTVKARFGYDYSGWNLPPVEASPFSQAHVDDFCIKRGKKGEPAPEQPANQPEQTPAAPALAEPQPETTPMQSPQADTEKAMSQAQKLSVLGAAIAGSAYSLDRVKRLPQPVKERSVELAREILDKLRMGISDTDRDQWLSQSTESALAQGSAVSSLAELYADSYQAALMIDPQLKDSPAILAGNEAIGKLAFLTKQQAAYALLEAGQHDDAQTLMAELQSYPDSWKQEDNLQVTDLLDQMQAGLELTHGTVQQARAKHKQVQEALAQESGSTGPRPRNVQTNIPAPTAPDAAAADCAELVANGDARLSPQQLQQLLQSSGLSAQDLEAVRHMQAQAATMPEEPRQAAARHAETVNRAAATEPMAQQGNYRSAVQSQSREPEVLKR